MPEELQLDTLLFAISDNGGGTAGTQTLDLRLDGTTVIAPGELPAFAYNATQLADTTVVATTTRLPAGSILTLHDTTQPTGGKPGWVEVVALCR